jgi:tRNA/rRNA methyltransferase
MVNEEPDSFDALAARVRFVLVAPSHPGNIGAAARAVKAMGFRRLAVVDPRVPGFRTDPEAVALATNAADVLAEATSHGNLTEALAGVTFAWAMTGYSREFGPQLVDLRSAAEAGRAHLLQRGEPVPAPASAAEIAFVFGTERSGLTNDEVARCQACCAIPADPVHGSLNLAQAVQVTAYELRLALGAAGVADRFTAESPASVEAIEGVYAHLEQALISVGYLDPASPGKLMARLRRLFARAHPTASEVDILRGICAAIVQRKSDRAGGKSPPGARG